MSAVPQLAHRDRPSSLYRKPTPGADVIQFPTSVRTRRERQQLVQQQLVSPPAPASLQRQSRSLASNAATVRSLPNVHTTPAWLQLLTVTQRTSSVVTFVLVAVVLAVYGWTVQTQQAWGRSHQRLETLQQQERQLTTANEALKHQLAQQAENPATGLVQSTPENAIFLEPAPPRPAPVVVTPVSNFNTTEPLGY